jgi:hypothetical protein
MVYLGVYLQKQRERFFMDDVEQLLRDGADAEIVTSQRLTALSKACSLLLSHVELLEAKVETLQDLAENSPET